MVEKWVVEVPDVLRGRHIDGGGVDVEVKGKDELSSLREGRFTTLPARRLSISETLIVRTFKMSFQIDENARSRMCPPYQLIGRQSEHELSIPPKS